MSSKSEIAAFVKRWSVLGALSFTLVFAYQNCGSDFVVKDSLDLGSITASGLSCELDAFNRTYKPFLTKCQGCHVPGGVGSGAFSSSNLQVAYDAFLLATTTKIDERSVNQNHAPGITGPVNQTQIDAIRPQFDNAIAACNQGPSNPQPPTPSVISSPKDIVANQATQTLTWNLATDVPGVSIPGASLSFTVASATQASGAVLYTISNPRLTTTTAGVNLDSIMFRINGTELPLVTTYSRVSRTVPANQANVQLSTAAAAFETAAPGAMPNRLSISFGSLEPQ